MFNQLIRIYILFLCATSGIEWTQPPVYIGTWIPRALLPIVFSQRQSIKKPRNIGNILQLTKLGINYSSLIVFAMA